MPMRRSFSSLESIFEEHQPSTVFAATLSLACMAMEAGVLALPVAFSTAGIAVAIGAVVFVAVFTVISVQFITECIEDIGANSYEEISKELLGPKFVTIARVTLIIDCLGAAIGYIVLLGDLTVPFHSEVHTYLPIIPKMYIREFLTIAVFLLTMFPLSLVREIGRLAGAAMLAVAAAIYLVLFIAYRYFFPLIGGRITSLPGHGHHRHHHLRPRDECVNPTVSYAHFNFLTLLVMPVIMYAFDCQTLVFQLYHSLPDADVPMMKRVASAAMAIVSTIFCCIGIFGYLSFGDCVKGNILLNYNPKVDKLAAIAYVFFGIPIVVAFVLTLIPCRDAVISSWYTVSPGSRKQLKAKRYYPIVATLSLTALFVAVLIPTFLTVISIIGALASSTLCFTFPGLFAYRMHTLGLIKAEGRRLWTIFAMVAVGLIGATVGTAAAVYQTYVGHQ